MITGTELADMISFVLWAHQNHSKIPSKAFRRFDGRTPYGIHPIWAAMTFFHEEKLPEELRLRGTKALLGHDLIEDTTVELPAWCKEPAVRALIRDLSYVGSDDKFIEVWNRGDESLLLAAYDVTANLMNASGFTSNARSERYAEHVENIVAHVERQWGNLNIAKITKGLLGKEVLSFRKEEAPSRTPLFFKKRYV